MKKRVNEGKYKSIHEAADDVRLIWKNCMTYNADGSDFYNLAQVRDIHIYIYIIVFMYLYCDDVSYFVHYNMYSFSHNMYGLI